MKTHLLRYFVVLAEELHFGRAASRLSITQPPLSVALKSLEQDLGVVLMVRDAKAVTLTAAGQAFLQEARKVLAQMQHAGDVARGMAQGRQGRLDLGMTGSMVYRQVPQWVNGFRQQRPLVEVCLSEMSSQEQLDALRSGRIDAGFVNTTHVGDAFETLAIGSEPLVCCLPQAHALAGLARIELQSLADESFVMFAREVAPANYDNVIACMQDAGIHPRTQHAARQWLTVIALVAAEQGVALVPACMAQTGLRGVSFVPLSRGRASIPACLVWRKAHTNQALQAFVALVQARCA